MADAINSRSGASFLPPANVYYEFGARRFDDVRSSREKEEEEKKESKRFFPSIRMRGSWMNRRRAGGKFNGGQGVSLLVGKPPECINHSRRAVLVLLSHFPSLLRNRLLPSTYTYETSELSSNSTWTVKSRPRVELIPRVRSINGGGSRSSIVKFHPFRVTWRVDVPLDTRVIYISGIIECREQVRAS